LQGAFRRGLTLARATCRPSERQRQVHESVVESIGSIARREGGLLAGVPGGEGRWEGVFGHRLQMLSAAQPRSVCRRCLAFSGEAITWTRGCAGEIEWEDISLGLRLGEGESASRLSSWSRL